MPEKKKEVAYRRWKEIIWHNPDIDWRKADIITAGVDIGSVTSQAVILCDGELFATSSMRTGTDSPYSALEAVEKALEGTGMSLEDIHYKIGTGYGRVNVPFADKTITEIACHARGANYMYGPTVRTVLDMGGQDCKAIQVDEKGRVLSFLMNDKCAAGTGRGMEVFAKLVGLSLDEVGEKSLQIDEEPDPVSSTCVVFAKKEATGLLRSGWPVERVLAAYCLATAQRVESLLARVGVKPDFVITGGIAKNIGIVTRLEKLLGLKSLETTYDTQIAGALGAALFGKDIVGKDRNKKQ